MRKLTHQVNLLRTSKANQIYKSIGVSVFEVINTVYKKSIGLSSDSTAYELLWLRVQNSTSTQMEPLINAQYTKTSQKL